MTSYASAFDSGFLARFTAAVASTVPEFDPELNPIGHALAVELFAGPEPEKLPEPQLVVWPERPVVVDAAPEKAAEDEAPVAPAVALRKPSPRPTSVVIELPLAAESPIEWFDATTEPDEELEHEIELEQVRRAS